MIRQTPKEVEAQAKARPVKAGCPAAETVPSVVELERVEMPWLAVRRTEAKLVDRLRLSAWAIASFARAVSMGAVPASSATTSGTAIQPQAEEQLAPLGGVPSVGPLRLAVATLLVESKLAPLAEPACQLLVERFPLVDL